MLYLFHRSYIRAQGPLNCSESVKAEKGGQHPEQFFTNGKSGLSPFSFLLSPFSCLHKNYPRSGSFLNWLILHRMTVFLYKQLAPMLPRGKAYRAYCWVRYEFPRRSVGLGDNNFTETAGNVAQISTYIFILLFNGFIITECGVH